MCNKKMTSGPVQQSNASRDKKMKEEYSKAMTTDITTCSILSNFVREEGEEVPPVYGGHPSQPQEAANEDG